MNIKNKSPVAIITGAAGLLGQIHAEAILEINGTVVLTDIDPDLALVRMSDRFLRKGRLINSDSAEAYRGQSIKTYNKLKQEGIADGYAKIDTTTGVGEPKKIFEDTAKIFEGTGL